MRSASSMRCRRSRPRGATIRPGALPEIDADAGVRRRGARTSADRLTAAASPTTSQVGPPGTLLARHRLEHVRQEHAASRHRAEHACSRRRAAASAPLDCGCLLPICRPAFACRTRSSSGSRTSWPRSRGSRGWSMRPNGRVTARVLLYLLDEILQGTNSAERSIAVRAVARHLLDAGAIGAMTTHDLNLAGEEPLKSSAVPRALHRKRRRARADALRLPAARRDRDVAKRASPDADDRHRSERALRRGPLRQSGRRSSPLLTVVMTWPQAASPGDRRAGTSGRVLQHVAVRVGRARARHVAVARLFDGNIFYPEPRTLTFSDAMPVEAVLATPLLVERCAAGARAQPDAARRHRAVGRRHLRARAAR